MINRRTLMAGLLALTGTAACATRSKAKTYILVHGAWHGGWCWAKVKNRLEAAGHKVIAPTLKGLGHRASEISADIGLEDHIEDVIRAAAGINKFILVGHSYGGMVITGVADRLGQQVEQLVYLDAVVPTDGRAMIDAHPSVTPEQAQRVLTQLSALAPDGVAMMPLPPELFGVPKNHPEYEWVREKLTPHPLKTWRDPIRLKNPTQSNRVFIHGNNPVIQTSTIPFFAAEAKASSEWAYYEIATGHDIMVTEPAKLSELLLSLAV